MWDTRYTAAVGLTSGVIGQLKSMCCGNRQGPGNRCLDGSFATGAKRAYDSGDDTCKSRPKRCQAARNWSPCRRATDSPFMKANFHFWYVVPFCAADKVSPSASRRRTPGARCRIPDGDRHCRAGEAPRGDDIGKPVTFKTLIRVQHAAMARTRSRNAVSVSFARDLVRIW